MHHHTQSRATTARAAIVRAAMLCAIAIASPGFLSAQARAWISRDCGHDARLRLSAASASQGGLLELEFKAPSSPTELSATWNEKTIQFWPDAKNANTHRAFIGIDLEQKSGTSKLDVNASLQDGESISCGAILSVKAGHFAIERLRLDPKFVQLNPEDTKRAEEETKHLRGLFALSTPERLWRGPFRVPLNGVKKGTNFGRRRVLNGQPGSPHSGLDLAAAAGTPVHATQRGRVVLAEALFFSGNTVILDHGLGLYTLYGHLESFAVSLGDTVAAGATLGRVGSTGRATGPHLHWGMYVNTAKVNPLGILQLSVN